MTTDRHSILETIQGTFEVVKRAFEDWNAPDLELLLISAQQLSRETAIINHVDTLLETSPDPEDREFLLKIRTSATEMTDLINTKIKAIYGTHP